jgi:hypothetical protein
VDIRVERPMQREKKLHPGASALFTTAPQNRSPAARVAAVGAERAKARSEAAESPSEPKTEPRAGSIDERRRTVASEFNFKDLPLLDAPWLKIQERVFNLEEPPEVIFARLEADLKLTQALTPGNLEAALEGAEDNARQAHRLYVVAVVAFEAYEAEIGPIVEAMRDAANNDLQKEKLAGTRNKAITDADIKGRAGVLFPDEWARVCERVNQVKGVRDHMKWFADLWKQRCYTLSALVHAGKR